MRAFLLLHGGLVEKNGVRPGELTQDADGEAIVEDLFDVGIVMTYGGDAAEEVANSTPPESNALGYSTMLADR